MNRFATIKTYMFPYEAAIDRARLEAHGMECFTRDEMTIQVHNFYSQALGGVKLQVRANDFEKAAEILGESVDLELETIRDDYFESSIKCPNCMSGNVTVLRINRIWSLVVLMLVALPIPFRMRKVHCYNCQSQFKIK
ncbi:hypothetical protein B0O79_2290 [Flavobacteriaceae bacterium MAR_2009_75]|nr:hypothetical protein B0O79_2290 [Flavobacteriaceae bacterium MAR_2009_75]